MKCNHAPDTRPEPNKVYLIPVSDAAPVGLLRNTPVVPTLIMNVKPGSPPVLVSFTILHDSKRLNNWRTEVNAAQRPGVSPWEDGRKPIKKRK